MKYSEAVKKMIDQMSEYTNETHRVTLNIEKKGIKVDRREGWHWVNLVDVYDIATIHISEYHGHIEEPIFDRLLDGRGKKEKDN